LKPGIDSHFEKNSVNTEDQLSELDKVVCEKLGLTQEEFKKSRG
jgi:hypothetical protein